MLGMKKKETEKQVIREEDPDVDPLDVLRKESEFEYNESNEEAVVPSKEKEDKSRWIVAEVPTQTEKIIFDNKTKKTYDIYSALVEILNKVDKE